MREHIITSIDAVIRKHPDCGIIVTGDFNQLNDNFLKTHYRFCSDCKCRHTGKCGVRKHLDENGSIVHVPDYTF